MTGYVAVRIVNKQAMSAKANGQAATSQQSNTAAQPPAPKVVIEIDPGPTVRHRRMPSQHVLQVILRPKHSTRSQQALSQPTATSRPVPQANAKTTMEPEAR